MLLKNLEKTLRVINKLKRGGLIQDYAIGGGMATLLYTEPFLTYDIDIFIVAPRKRGLILLPPVYDYLKRMGYKTKDEYIVIEGIPVQFIPTYNNLTEEALKHSKETAYKRTQTRVFRPEYLMALMVQTNRPKDRERAIKLLNEGTINKAYLKTLLRKYGLMKRFQKIISW